MNKEEEQEIINIANELEKSINTLRNDNENNKNHLKINILETKLLIFESEYSSILNNQSNNKNLQISSFKCPITKAYNHKYFNKQIKIINNNDFKNLSLAIIKVNNLFEVNNRYGYKAGDEVLKVATNNIFSIVKNNENIEVVRFYGSEFRILFYNIPNNDVYGILYKIKKVMKKAFVTVSSGININYTTAISVSFKQNEKDTIDLIIDRAFKKIMSLQEDTDEIFIAEEDEQLMESYKQKVEEPIQSKNTLYEDIIGNFSFKVKNNEIKIAGNPMVIILNDKTIYYGE